MKLSSLTPGISASSTSAAFGPWSASSACSFIWSTTTARGRRNLELVDVAELGRAVDDDVEILAAPGRHQIVDDPAVVLEQQRIFELHVAERLEVGWEQGF